MRPTSTPATVNIDSFPALPATVVKVLQVTADPESSAEDLMKVVLPDQSMCSAILKIANSAFFGIPREVSTIERAVMVIGFEEVRNVIVGKALFASFPKLNASFKETVNLFWEHSFCCGLVAKIIGKELGVSQSELFVAGLIHDIGKLAMLLTFPNNYPLFQGLTEPRYTGITTFEKSDFGTSHDAVGQLLANHWLLPQKLVMSIAHHHNPQDAPFEKQFPLIIQVADILSYMHCSPDLFEPQDVKIIFKELLSEPLSLWSANGLPLDLDTLVSWFELLGESREENQSILDIFTSS